MLILINGRMMRRVSETRALRTGKKQAIIASSLGLIKMTGELDVRAEQESNSLMLWKFLSILYSLGDSFLPLFRQHPSMQFGW